MPRTRVGKFLLAFLAGTTCRGGALAFQPPTILTRGARPLRGVDSMSGRFGSNASPSRVVVSLSSDNEEEPTLEPRIPFFARAMQKLRSQKEEVADAMESIDGEKKVEAIAMGGSKSNDVDSEAATLRALAERMRLEAEKMDMSLTLAKITKLEERTSEADEIPNLLVDIESLMKKANAPKQIANGVPLSDTPMASESFSARGSEVATDESPSAIIDSEDEGGKNIAQQVLDGDKPLLSDEKRQDAIDGFEELPQPIRDMMARTVGMEDGANATAIVDKLMAENRLFQGDGDEKFSMIAKTDDLDVDDMDIFVDLEFAEINSFVESLLPAVTRKEPVNEEYVDALYNEVLGKDTFNPRERKAQAVPGGYLIRGESKVRSREGRGDGDVLVEALDEKIAKSSVAGKIQAYYILDPTPASGEEIMNDEDELPVLLITNRDISPATEAWVKPAATFLGLVSIWMFSLGSFSFNEDVISRISAITESGDGNIDFMYGLSFPIAFSLLAIQLVHEAGHLIVALKDGIDIGLPTLVPGFQFGITGGITPIKSSPKNMKSLFDFAIAGPLLGLVASIILLYLGLEMTAFTDASAELPSVPLQILRSSALGGGMIDYLLGDGVLNSPDPASDMIKLHPYAIAGFGGLMTNALGLLPLGNTDGGRISLAFFGRAFSQVVQGTALVVLILAGFFGADEANILLCYAIYSQLWQKEPEVPCRNEVDELDTARGFIAIGTTLIVLLTLTPMS